MTVAGAAVGVMRTVQRIVLRSLGPRPTGGAVGKRGMRLFVAYSQADPVLAVAAIVFALGGAWVGCVLMGGSHSAGPHLFYVGIALAAVRFAMPAAAAASLAAGLLAGPLLPADVASGIAQEPGAWLLRLGFFLGIGVFVALLVQDDGDTVRSRLRDAFAAARLLRALKSGAVEIFYQPIYRVTDDRFVAVEALVRWRQSSGRYLSPDHFIPTAERTGAITHLDEYVLNRAVATAHAWSVGGRPLAVSVNLSASTLAQPDIVQMVEQVLADVGFPAPLLQLEITESALVHDLPTAICHVEQLRALGVKVAIDDFGSGHASLNYLQSFRVDVIKLDRSIITAATIDDRSRRLLQGAVHMCELLDLQVVAEGVEFDDQLALLRQIGVSMAQGFLLGRPAPADDIHPLVDTPTAR